MFGSVHSESALLETAVDFGQYRDRVFLSSLGRVDGAIPSPVAAVPPAAARRIVGRRYALLEWLGRGGMGEIFRAHDRLTSRVVALKKLTDDGERRRFRPERPGRAQESLASEFQLLASLHHPNVVRVLDYGIAEDGLAYYTMELLEDAPPITRAARNQSEEVRVSLLIQLLQALEYLHRRGVIHRDLKPSNVLVAAGQVKLVDFGVSISCEEAAAVGVKVSGTVSYMAPEMLSAVPPSAATDLYAAGVIAYQLFAGQHPFLDPAHPGLTALLDRIVTQRPDLTAIRARDSIRAVIDCLLAKRPDERYPDAGAAIRDLSLAIGQPPPEETPAIRNSYLHGAGLVGRAREIARLARAVADAVDGRGSFWLVAGEGGAGKSRLLDEVRVRGLISGMLVLRDLGEERATGPFGAWREVVRRLCLLAPPKDRDAQVLEILVPDLGELINRPRPPLAPSEARRRLPAVIERLLLRLRQPTLLLLDDLHLADRESLALLARLGPVVNDRPLLILGAYSDDQAARLPGELLGAVSSWPPHARVGLLALPRLGEESIAELSAAMLGPDGVRPDLVAFLERESEGNVRHLIEVIRSLADEAGDLRRIGRLPLARCRPRGPSQRGTTPPMPIADHLRWRRAA